MSDRTITIREPTNATMDVEVRLRREVVDGTTVIQVTAIAMIDGVAHQVTWDPRGDVDAVKNSARDFMAAVIASAKSRWGF